jgi:protein associated with RNAse G/E
VANPVHCHKRKFDGTGKPPWDGDLVDADDDWLAVFFEDPPWWNGRPAVTRYAMRFYSLRHPLSVLVAFDANGSVLQYQCDAGLPATIRGRDIAFVDLDLDVIAHADLDYRVRDQEQFDARRVTMGYTPEAVACAHEGIALAKSLIGSRSCPFDGTPERILGMALASRGPL